MSGLGTRGSGAERGAAVGEVAGAAVLAGDFEGETGTFSFANAPNTTSFNVVLPVQD